MAGNWRYPTFRRRWALNGIQALIRSPEEHDDLVAMLREFYASLSEADAARHFGADVPTDSRIERWLEADHVLLAFVDSTLIGEARLFSLPSGEPAAAWVVASTWRSAGVDRALVGVLEQYARAQGRAALVLAVAGQDPIHGWLSSKGAHSERRLGLYSLWRLDL